VLKLAQLRYIYVVFYVCTSDSRNANRKKYPVNYSRLCSNEASNFVFKCQILYSFPEKERMDTREK